MTNFTNINEMPEWPKQMACDKAKAQQPAAKWTPSDVGHGFGTLDALALMCWQFCEEPVDPDLLIAREAMAQTYEAVGNPTSAALCHGGDCDNLLKDGPTHIAARLAREQGAK